MTDIQFSPDEIRAIAHRVEDAGAPLGAAKGKLVFPAAQPGFSSPEAARSYTERLSEQLTTMRDNLDTIVDQLLATAARYEQTEADNIAVAGGIDAAG